MLTSSTRVPRRRLSTARADEVALSSAETAGSVADWPRAAEAATGLTIASPRTDVSAEPATHNPLLSTLISSRLVMMGVSSEQPVGSSGFQRSIEIARPGPAILIYEGVSVMLFSREFQPEDHRWCDFAEFVRLGISFVTRTSQEGKNTKEQSWKSM
jgi:hypothetical protein